MPFTREAFGRKLQTMRLSFAETVESMSIAIGISVNRLSGFENANLSPTGDEILILSDFFKCDFRYFTDDDAPQPNEGVEVLFRKYGDEISSFDRHSIAEFAHLCATEHLLEDLIGRARRKTTFSFTPTGTFYKSHGTQCAAAFRNALRIPTQGIVGDVFGCIRDIGIRVFRRRLENSSISGLFMRHPEAGSCILVNYAEGIPRQRFSAAHELGHALLDESPTSFSMQGDWSSTDLVEIRANTFAQDFLIPPELTSRIPADQWTPDRVVEWASRLMVSVPALLAALWSRRLIPKDKRDQVRDLRLRADAPSDPELGEDLAPSQRVRKEALLQRGLSTEYVGLAFDAYEANAISRGKLAEALLIDSHEVAHVGALFGRSLRHD